MSTKSKLSESELAILNGYQVELSNLIGNLGEIELQIADLKSLKEQQLTIYNELKAKQTKTAKELQDKYGEGNISLEDGEFTPTS
jgi:hypothetical protein